MCPMWGRYKDRGLMNMIEETMLERKVKALTKIISDIEDIAFDWDGKESSYYGNKIMKAIHKDWNA